MDEQKMDCEHCEEVLFDFHEGTLEPALASRVDNHLKNCSDCSQLLNDIWQMSLVSTRWQEESVPDWDRGKGRSRSPAWQFPQLLATAASLLALVLVLTDVHFTTTDNGLTLRMGRDDQVSAAALTSLRNEQQGYLNESMQRLTTQQAATNQLMLQTILESSRQERREDFSTLVTYWNSVQASQQQETEENLRYLLATQAEDEKDIQQLSAALQQISYSRGTDM